jgi:hypothetical protein
MGDCRIRAPMCHWPLSWPGSPRAAYPHPWCCRQALRRGFACLAGLIAPTAPHLLLITLTLVIITRTTLHRSSGRTHPSMILGTRAHCERPRAGLGPLRVPIMGNHWRPHPLPRYHPNRRQAVQLMVPGTLYTVIVCCEVQGAESTACPQSPRIWGHGMQTRG